MAMVYKCDRCGKIVDNVFDGGGNGPFVWDGTLSKDQEHMDLCEECYNDLIRWLSRDKPRGADKNNDCAGCQFTSYAEHMYPCNCCSHNFVDRFVTPEEPRKQSERYCFDCKYSNRAAHMWPCCHCSHIATAEELKKQYCSDHWAKKD